MPLYRVRFTYAEGWVGEVPADVHPEHCAELVIDVAELVWEPVAD